MGKKFTRNSDKWKFLQNEDFFWYWERRTKQGDLVSSSVRVYLDKLKCIENAKKNCYNPKK